MWLGTLKNNQWGVCHRATQWKERAWEEFTTTLNYKMQVTKVMKVLKLIQRTPPGSPANSILVTTTGKLITSDKGKAEMFRCHFAKLSKRPALPKGRKAKAKHRKLKGKIRLYVKWTDISTQASLPYSFEELTVAIGYLKHRKTFGEDEIHNENLIMSDEILWPRILHLVNLIWKQACSPGRFSTLSSVQFAKAVTGKPANHPKIQQTIVMWP